MTSPTLCWPLSPLPSQSSFFRARTLPAASAPVLSTHISHCAIRFLPSSHHGNCVAEVTNDLHILPKPMDMLFLILLDLTVVFDPEPLSHTWLCRWHTAQPLRAPLAVPAVMYPVLCRAWVVWLHGLALLTTLSFKPSPLLPLLFPLPRFYFSVSYSVSFVCVLLRC